MKNTMGATDPSAEDFEAAQSAYQRAESDYEHGVMSGDPTTQVRTRAALRQAAEALAQARSLWLEQRATTRPSFEDVLRNPLSQMDTSGAVLDSIRKHWTIAPIEVVNEIEVVDEAAAAVAREALFSPTVPTAPGSAWQREAPTPGAALVSC